VTRVAAAREQVLPLSSMTVGLLEFVAMGQLGISRYVEAAISTSVLLVPRATAWLVMVISGKNNAASSALFGFAAS
jgi:hypothetical protein